MRACPFRAAPMWGVLLPPLLLLASGALAQSAKDPAWGTIATRGRGAAAKAVENAPTPAAIAVSPAVSYANAAHATTGVALRNRRTGVMPISGVAAPVKRAYLYWAFLYLSTPPSSQQVSFCKQSSGAPGDLACTVKTGTLLATGPDTCWASNGIAVYRSDVTSSISGNGTYVIVLPSTASGASSGDDPWASGPRYFPLAEGASLVVIGSGARTVSVYDRGIAARTFLGTFDYTLRLSGGVRSTPVIWDNIGADGQVGGSRASSAATAGESTFVNGVRIAGPGVDTSLDGVTDGDWNGGVGSPIPQLWDVTSHSLPASAAPVGASSLAVRFTVPSDCLSPIANVVSY
jgi:hypothetical protein